MRIRLVNTLPAGIAEAPVTKIHAAPPALSKGPPTMAVVPLPAIETDHPWEAPTPSEPTSLTPSCVQTPPPRIQAKAAPVLQKQSPTTTPSLLTPPMMAVLPSAESDTES